METRKILRGTRVLIADDQKDILDVLVDPLDLCTIDTASSFGEAKETPLPTGGRMIEDKNGTC
jgi:hypothetical protein